MKKTEFRERAANLDSFDLLWPLTAEMRAAELQIFLSDLELDAGKLPLPGRQFGQVVPGQSARGVFGELVRSVRLQVKIGTAGILRGRCRDSDADRRQGRQKDNDAYHQNASERAAPF